MQELLGAAAAARAQLQTAGPGDAGALALSRYVNLNASLAYTDAYYVDFKNGPTPVEALNPTTGGSAVTDLSGKPLSGVPDVLVALSASAHPMLWCATGIPSAR